MSLISLLSLLIDYESSPDSKLDSDSDSTLDSDSKLDSSLSDIMLVSF